MPGDKRERRRVWNHGTATRDRWCVRCGERMDGSVLATTERSGVVRGVCRWCAPFPRMHAAAAMLRNAAQVRAEGPHVLRGMRARDFVAMARDERKAAHAAGCGVPR